MVVTECDDNCVSIITSSGEKNLFGSAASQFNNSFEGLAIDAGGNILVVNADNHSIQQFSPTGRYIHFLKRSVKWAGVSSVPKSSRHCC